MGKRERVRERRRKKRTALQEAQPAPTTSSGRGATSSAAAALPRIRHCTRYDQEPRPSVLVVGDGDFSFAHGLLRHRGGDPAGLFVTSFDRREEVLRKYPKTAPRTLRALREANVRVAHGVDASKLKVTLTKHGGGAGETWDRILWNFPHAGEQRTHLNRALVKGFLAGSRQLLAPGGQCHVTLRLVPPYSRWDVGGTCAEGTGMVLGAELPFDASLFPGYKHQTTKADAKNLFKARSAKEAAKEAQQVKTFVFVAAKSARGGAAAAMEEDEGEDSGREEDSEEEQPEEPEVPAPMCKRKRTEPKPPPVANQSPPPGAWGAVDLSTSPWLAELKAPPPTVQVQAPTTPAPTQAKARKTPKSKNKVMVRLASLKKKKQEAGS